MHREITWCYQEIKTYSHLPAKSYGLELHNSGVLLYIVHSGEFYLFEAFVSVLPSICKNTWLELSNSGMDDLKSCCKLRSLFRKFLKLFVGKIFKKFINFDIFNIFEFDNTEKINKLTTF